MTAVYETEKAIVRIHEGKRTEAERRKVLEESAKRLMMAVEKQKAVKSK